MEKVSARLEETGNGINGATAWKGLLLQGTRGRNFDTIIECYLIPLHVDICILYTTIYTVNMYSISTWYIGITGTSVHRIVIWLHSRNFFKQSLKTTKTPGFLHRFPGALSFESFLYDVQWLVQVSVWDEKGQGVGGRRSHGFERSELLVLIQLRAAVWRIDLVGISSIITMNIALQKTELWRFGSDFLQSFSFFFRIVVDLLQLLGETRQRQQEFLLFFQKTGGTSLDSEAYEHCLAQRNGHWNDERVVKVLGEDWHFSIETRVITGGKGYK